MIWVAEDKVADSRVAGNLVVGSRVVGSRVAESRVVGNRVADKVADKVAGSRGAAVLVGAGQPLQALGWQGASWAFPRTTHRSWHLARSLKVREAQRVRLAVRC